MFRISTLRKTLLGAALLTAVSGAAFGRSADVLGGPDDSQSFFGGDGYTYFHEGRPAGDKSLPPYRVTHPKGTPEAAYVALSSEDPEWQPAERIDKATPPTDPVPAVASKAGEIRRFEAMDRYLESASTP